MILSSLSRTKPFYTHVPVFECMPSGQEKHQIEPQVSPRKSRSSYFPPPMWLSAPYVFVRLIPHLFSEGVDGIQSDAGHAVAVVGHHVRHRVASVCGRFNDCHLPGKCGPRGRKKPGLRSRASTIFSSRVPTLSYFCGFF